MSNIPYTGKTEPVKDGITITWLGQAGFLIKGSSGLTVAIDPYLTDHCEKLVGFRRLSPSVMAPESLKTDLFLSSHTHADHFDAPAVSVIMSGTKTVLAGPGSVMDECMKLGIDRCRLIPLDTGDSMEMDGIDVRAVYADHGDLSPDAVGFLINMDGVLIYFAGDTSYKPEKFGDVINAGPDIIILPINGAYGNLNEEEAARLTKDCGARFTIPCHFWTFREHGGDPQKFFEAVKTYAPDSMVLFMTPGVPYKYDR
jgi:L-ascorbate 6-phosphate lactonase